MEMSNGGSKSVIDLCRECLQSSSYRGGSVNGRLLAIACIAPMSVVLICGQSAPTAPPPKPAARPVRAQGPAPGFATQRAILDQYCVGCHNAKLRTANLLLDQLDLAHLGDHAEVGEKIVRKLSAGMTPPSGLPRPGPATPH